MTDASVRSAQRADDEKRAAVAREGRTLDHRYGRIGILAVAAAARYQGDARNPAYAPAAAASGEQLRLLLALFDQP